MSTQALVRSILNFYDFPLYEVGEANLQIFYIETLKKKRP